MNSAKEVLRQLVARGGRPKAAGMAVGEVRQLDPGFCQGLEAAPGLSLAEHPSPDEQATLTEAEVRPVFDTKVRGACFASIEGYRTVKSGPTGFRHHGFYVVDEPCAGAKPKADHSGHVSYVVMREAARIPGEVALGEVPADVASGTKMPPPDISNLGLSEAERSCHDLRHVVRGGPHLANH